MSKVTLAVLLFWLCIGQVSASIDVYEFDSEAERLRYQQFLDELRCPKCKNNNLAGTNSKIAVDLRRQLQEMIKEGKTDQEIVDYMVLRYGDFVLYRPRLQGKTIALWLGPIVFLGVGVLAIGGIVWRRRRRLAHEQTETLSEAESQALARLLENEQSAGNAKQQ